MSENHPGGQVLEKNVVDRRLLLLAGLQEAWQGLGVHGVLTRNHRLVLRYENGGPYEPSGLTDPQLHVFLPAGAQHVTTDGANYWLAGQQVPARDPAAAAAAVISAWRLARPDRPGPRSG